MEIKVKSTTNQTLNSADFADTIIQTGVGTLQYCNNKTIIKYQVQEGNEIENITVQIESDSVQIDRLSGNICNTLLFTLKKFNIGEYNTSLGKLPTKIYCKEMLHQNNQLILEYILFLAGKHNGIFQFILEYEAQ